VADAVNLSRRAFLTGAAGAAGVAATATAAAVASGGCAALPRVTRGHGTHPCDHPHCRYWRAPAAGAGMGRCALVLRVKGGRP